MKYSKLQFEKATKEKSKLRLALFGPSGAGKTFSALRIATGMGKKIALIDSESGSASKYADRFDFDVLDIGTKTIEVYIEAMKAAEAAGYEILIIDSLSHAWKELLAEVDKLANTRFKGNTFAAWSKGTPKQRTLVDAILSFDGHIIATIRSKTEWAVNTVDGKSKPERIGLAPEQGKGIEYEFDLLMEITPEHVAHVLKDRTGKYQDDYIEKPGEKFGKELIEWLSEGEFKERKTKDDYRQLVDRIGIDDDEAKKVYDSFAGDFTKAYEYLLDAYDEVLDAPEKPSEQERLMADVKAGDPIDDSVGDEDTDVTEEQPEVDGEIADGEAAAEAAEKDRAEPVEG